MSTHPKKTVKTLVARRQNYRCAVCGRDLLDAWVRHSFHHRHMRSHPMPDLHEPHNLLLVCGSGTEGCHHRIHANPEWAYRMGYLVHMENEHPENRQYYDKRRGWLYLNPDGTDRPAPEPEEGDTR